MKRIALAAATLAVTLAAGGALAQTVWRCGAEGRSYSDTPCPGGQALALADDSRSPEQMAAAREVAAREKRLAERMVAEREHRERLLEREHRLAAVAAARAQRVAAIKAAKAAVKPGAPAPKAQKPAPADDGTWRAVAPASRRDRG
ncbi:Eukaryotic translation initiation factor 4B [Rubrivivax sp. A210]|uniref:hypothetical protein n=1 Tax=Rubrivivax sp. A210 TaxID=2772301 RepID=UPI00191AC610|nr:hypothetical protein [Rubrivivax sp. A210]CAD5372178.1 Eukaryotic translation initiation factor 4B [Rubrivivax sp. A210]